MLGISQEAIRYYEKQGVVLFEKEEETGYRFFFFRKLIAMVSLRLFNHLGFSIKESYQLVNGEDTHTITSSLYNNEQQITDQIERLERMKQYSANLRKIIDDIPNRLYHFSIQKSPAFYHIKFQSDRKVLKDKQREEIIKTWYEKSPVVVAGLLAPLSNLHPGFQVEMGFSVPQKDFDRWIGTKDDVVQFIPSAKALYTVIEVPLDSVDFFEPLVPIVSHLKQHTLKTKDLIYAIPLATRCKIPGCTEIKDFYEVYVPLEN